jgi:hypothetical protein
MSTVPAAAAHPALRGPPMGVATAFVLALSIAASWATAGDAHASPRSRGRPLTEVLEELQLAGLNLIYSSEVVRSELVVSDEPEPGTPREILDQILPPLGLQATDGASGAILIVRATPRPFGSIAGRVVESVRGGPVAGALLTIEGTNLRGAAGRDGRFNVSDVPAGTHSLRVAAPGFLDRVSSGVIVDPEGIVDLAIALEIDPRFVDDVVVTPGHRGIVQQDPGAVRSLDREDVIAAPTPGGDPTRIVALLPGIAAPEGSAAFNARGAAAKDVSLVLDGLQLYDPFHLSAFQSPFSFVDGRVIDAVDFQGGGFTADRGDRHGGFVEISTVTASDTASTQLELGTMNSRIAYQAPTRVGPLLVSGRYWYPQAIGDTIPYGADGLSPTFGDLYVKLGFVTTPTTVVSGHALLASDRATLSETDGKERVSASNGSGYFWIRASHSWPQGFATDTVISGGRIMRDLTGIAEPEDVAVAVEDRRSVRFAGVKNDASWAIGSSQLVRGGLDVQLLSAELAHAAGAEGATSTVAASPTGAALGAYLAYRASIGARVVTEAGLRWDRQTYTRQSQWSPRFNLVWLAGERSELRLGAGRYAQSLRVHELRIEDGETGYSSPEVGEQLDVAYIHRFRRAWSLRVDAYRHRFGRLQPHSENLFDPLELFPEVAPDRVVVAPESAVLQGLELSVRGNSGAPFQWMMSYTWSRAADMISGAEVRRSWDQPHAGSFLLAYQWRSGWFLSFSGTVHTGWPTTPVTGIPVTQPDGSTEIAPVLGPRNSTRLPAYARLDMKTGRSFATSKGVVRVELSVVNLTDRENACCVDEVQFEQGPSGRIEAATEYDYWMGITPSFQVAWSF